VADVAVIEQFTAAFKQQDFTYGSGLIQNPLHPGVGGS